jgi:hypothetical protein
MLLHATPEIKLMLLADRVEANETPFVALI